MVEKALLQKKNGGKGSDLYKFEDTLKTWMFILNSPEFNRLLLTQGILYIKAPEDPDSTM